MRTAIYARKSEESEDRQVQSIDDQLNVLRDVALRDGLQVDEIFTEAKSAKEPYIRPQFKRLIDAIEAGEINRLFVWSMNRLSRNEIDGGLISFLLRTGKLEFIRTPERTYKPEDSALILAIENGMATSFIQDLTRNVRRGMEGKAARGWRPGRAPIGYLNNVLTHEIEIDPIRFPLLRKAWDLILNESYSLTEVHDEMKALGLTSRNSKGKHRPVSRHTMFELFSNPFYTGQFMFKGNLLPGRHEPLVSQAEFDSVQNILGRGEDRRVRTGDFAFSGLLRCGQCGCQIVGERRVKHYRATNRTATYTYYHCTNAKGNCSKRSWTEDRILEKFQAVFEQIKLPENVCEWAIQESLRQGEQELTTLAAGAATIDDQVKGKKQRLDRLHEMRLDDEVSKEEYQSLKSKIEDEISHLKKTSRRVMGTEERIQLLVKEKLRLAARIDSYSAKTNVEKRGMVRALGSTHYLTLENLEISVHPILQKIAAFKPLRDGSQSPKVGDLVGADSVWSTLVSAIRTSARLAESVEVGQTGISVQSLHKHRDTNDGNGSSGRMTS